MNTLRAAVCVVLIAGTAAAAPITLVQDGKPTATIVVADQPVAIPVEVRDPKTGRGMPVTQRYAAEELQRFIEKATGARLEIVKASQAPAEGTLLLVGRNAVSQKHQLALPTESEGLRIVSFERGLAILGEVAPVGTYNSDQEADRGTLHGVYEFLERIAGYRFFIHLPEDPDFGTVIPHVKTLAVRSDYDLSLAPDFPWRRAGFSNLEPRVARQSVGPAFTGASWTDEGFGKAFLGKHPDWRAMTSTNGTFNSRSPCYSHPGVLAARVEATRDVYDGKAGWFSPHGRPGAKWISFQPDGSGLCLCERCLPKIRSDAGHWGKLSNLVFSHGVGFADEIAKRWPDKRLVVLATQQHTLPPDFDLPENVDVHVFLPWPTTLAKEPYWHENGRNVLRAWGDTLGRRRERLYVWNFLNWPSHRTEAPLFFPHALQKWLREIHPICAGEYISEGSTPPQFEMVMAWLWHRLLWDRNADVDALLRDQCMTFFGPAGPTMARVYATVIDRYENVRWSRELEACYIPPELLYGETYPAPVIDTLKKLLQKALAETPSEATSIYRRRVMWMQDGFAPFFEEADLAHQWLGNAPTYTVADVSEVPADAAAWAALPALTLVQGQYGAKPDLATRIRLARCGNHVFVRVEAEEPMVPMIVDRLAIFVKGAERKTPLHVTGEGSFPFYELPQELAGYAHAEGIWTVTLKFPAAELGIAPGEAKTVEVQFERRREKRGDTPRTEYYWMPPMRPQDPNQMRFGRLEVKGFER
jgi:hypothetical protein